MSELVRPPYRADHVGSLLRPRTLLQMRERAKRGEITLAALRAHEDACIRHAVKLQEDVGLHAITDGEYRRESFHGDFIGKLSGVEFKLLNPAGPGADRAGRHSSR